MMSYLPRKQLEQIQIGDDRKNNYKQYQTGRQRLYNPRHELGHPLHVPLNEVTYTQRYHQGKHVSHNVLIRNFYVATLENQLPQSEQPQGHHSKSGDGAYGRHHNGEV